MCPARIHKGFIVAIVRVWAMVMEVLIEVMILVDSSSYGLDYMFRGADVASSSYSSLFFIVVRVEVIIWVVVVLGHTILVILLRKWLISR